MTVTPSPPADHDQTAPEIVEFLAAPPGWSVLMHITNTTRDAEHYRRYAVACWVVVRDETGLGVRAMVHGDGPWLQLADEDSEDHGLRWWSLVEHESESSDCHCTAADMSNSDRHCARCGGMVGERRKWPRSA